MQPIDSVNDKILIQRYLKDEDELALRTLFQPHEEGLFRYLWQMLKHQQDSEDALQDTFRKAIEALPRYREENHFKSWLFRIAHNTALEVIRRRKKIIELSENSENLLEDPAKSPRELLARSERTVELREAIASLPEHERSVVLLRLQEELSFKEIAEVIGAPLGTALARMHKAKERLRTKLSPA